MFKKLFSKKLNIDDLIIDVDDCDFEGIHNGIKVWRTKFGDAFGVYFFDLPPDLPSKIDNVENYYENQLKEVNGEIVEYKIEQIDNFKIIKLLCKFPQEPSGMTYIHSITIPLKNCSYVIKGQFEEYGNTGLREALLSDKFAKQKMNDSFDNERYDNEFPDHPVSRARKTFNINIKNINLSDSIKKCISLY